MRAASAMNEAAIILNWDVGGRVVVERQRFKSVGITKITEGRRLGERRRRRLLDRGRALLPCRLLSWRWRTLQGTLGFSFA